MGRVFSDASTSARSVRKKFGRRTAIDAIVCSNADAGLSNEQRSQIVAPRLARGVTTASTVDHPLQRERGASSSLPLLLFSLPPVVVRSAPN
ncbi:hypothetical protein WN48_01988 [Eufriesea mexicana]|nr:hypothetical protein WN48_01988 [Eufriesea mexicana]